MYLFSIQINSKRKVAFLFILCLANVNSTITTERYLLDISLILAIVYNSRRGEMIAMSKYSSTLPANPDIKRELKEQHLSMSARSFEFFAGEFLVYVGLEGVSVTCYDLR